MVRKYRPKKRPQWADKDRRMAHVVQMRGDGLSLRQIAQRLGVSVGTVHADLKRWEHERSNVTPLPRKEEPPRVGVWSARFGGALLEDRTAVQNGSSKLPRTGAELNTPIEHPDSNIVPIRRSS